MSDKWPVTRDEQAGATAKLQEEERTQGFRDLLVWQKGMELAKAIYGISRKFPAEEKLGKLVTRH